MSNPQSPTQSSYQHKQASKYPFCYFWLKFQNKCQFLRIQINPDLFCSLDQLKQHLSNHFSLNELPNLYIINEDGKFSQIKDEKNKISSNFLNDIPNNSMFILEPNGMTSESVFPDFSAKYYNDQDQDQKDKPQKRTIPENIAVVKAVFSDWSLLLQTIHKINTKNRRKNDMEGSNKKDERRSKKKDEDNEEVEKKKIPFYTVQSLFTETGDFSALFFEVAKQMKIRVSSNPKYGSPLRLKKKLSS